MSAEDLVDQDRLGGEDRPHSQDPPPPDLATLLWAARPWAIKNHGFICEGDVFSVLFGLDHVVRSFEFAAVDGAVCLEAPACPSPGASYAERLLSTREHARKNPGSRHYLQFDVKSTTGLESGSQKILTRAWQHQKVAFYIVSCVSDPGFVAVIPSLPSVRPDRDRFIVGPSKSLAVPGVAYGFLDPALAAHRMPLGLLPTAVERICECAMAAAGDGARQDYVNPWTGLVYAGWQPRTTDQLDDLWPRETTEHHSAFLGVLALWQELRLAWEEGDEVGFDIVGLQPRLADLKILYRGRQWLVQCKSDVRERGRGNLTNVPIARTVIESSDDGEGEDDPQETPSVRPYFASQDRFDFLLYELCFTDGTVGLFFLPEHVLPDDLFASPNSMLEFSFDRPEFLQYFIVLENRGDVAKHVLDIIDRNPIPRRASRPHRITIYDQPVARKVTHRLRQMQAMQVPQTVPEPKESNRMICHRRLFRGIFDQCAKRLSGALVVFARNHPACDFGFIQYRWTELERDAYISTGAPPVSIHDLPADMPVVPFYAFARDMSCDWRGPMLSGAEFRRVNSWQPARLLVFDAMAAEDPSFPGPLFVIPTTDLSVTPQHMQQYLDHVNVNKKNGDRHKRVPLARELLHSGHNVVEYAVPRGGPFLYEQSGGWAELWTLLDRFAGTRSFCHPAAHRRSPKGYRIALRRLHTRWWEEASARASSTLVGRQSADQPSC